MQNEHTDEDRPLPERDTLWTSRRKAWIVRAVCEGSISLPEACRRYDLSVAEFRAWRRAVKAYGIPGLRATRVQIYRRAASKDRRGGRAEVDPKAAVDTDKR